MGLGWKSVRAPGAFGIERRARPARASKSKGRRLASKPLVRQGDHDAPLDFGREPRSSRTSTSTWLVWGNISNISTSSNWKPEVPSVATSRARVETLHETYTTRRAFERPIRSIAPAAPARGGSSTMVRVAVGTSNASASASTILARSPRDARFARAATTARGSDSTAVSAPVCRAKRTVKLPEPSEELQGGLLGDAGTREEPLAELRVHDRVSLGKGPGRDDQRFAIGAGHDGFRVTEARGNAGAFEPDFRPGQHPGRDALVQGREERPSEVARPPDVEHRTLARAERNAHLASTLLRTEEIAKLGQRDVQAGIEHQATSYVDQHVARALSVSDADPAA